MNIWWIYSQGNFSSELLEILLQRLTTMNGCVDVVLCDVQLCDNPI